jgi:glycosyltransferase involved in cell wall biosynthesis
VSEPSEIAISVIIPCYNEAAFLPRLLTSIDTARRAFSAGPDRVEIIVSDNASTDATAAIAAASGCRVVFSTIRRIGAVRNAGAAVARGAIVAFIDADSQVHPDTFNVIAAVMARGDVGGGTTGATMERWSAGIAFTYALFLTLVWATNMDIGVVFCRREDFESIGGYDEILTFAEDVKFLFQLRRLGRARGRRLVRARAAKVIASTRKFDQFGDWHYLTLLVMGPWYLISRRRRNAFADRYWYKSGR